MARVGRNDPCPCGSGKKFKRCCLGKDASPAVAFTLDERRVALNELFRFAHRTEFDDARRIAEAGFWADRLDALSDEAVKDVLRLGQSDAAFREWFAYDVKVTADQTILDRFLARYGDRLRSGERRYLERMRLTHIRPYEVLAVRLDEGLDLLDLWANKRLRVRERSATHDLSPWDVLAVRVTLGGDGDVVLDGMPYLYPPSAKDPLLKALRGLRREFRRGADVDDDTAFFKEAGFFYHVFWLDHVALRSMPSVVTAEGDDFSFARVVFDVQDRDALLAALNAHPDLGREDDGSFVWLKRNARRRSREADPPIKAEGVTLETTVYRPGKRPRRSLGVFRFEGKRLVFEATSKPRGERGRQFLEALVGEAVKYRATRYEDVERALERTPSAPRASAIPADVQERLLGEFYERHYRGWPDMRLPALGNRTPREAVLLKTGRPKVIGLLKEFENLSERQRRDGRAAYDFSWLWAELGLDRPG